jgi:PAS domain S-box-containing protein
MPHSPLDTDHSWFKPLFDLSPDPTWIIDGNRFVECNEAAISTLGYKSRDEFLNVHPSKLSPPNQPDGEDSYVKAERMMAIAKDKGLHRFEWTHNKADGAEFFAEVTLSAIAFGNQQVIYCVWRDITERKKAEAVLRRHQLMLARTEGIAHIGSWEWEVATGAVTWSDELYRIFQLNLADGAPSLAEQAKIYYPKDMQRLNEAVEAAVVHGTPYSMELRALRKDGAARICQARGYAEMGENMKVDRLYGSLEDITERKQAEAALLLSEQRLQLLITQAPVALAMFDRDLRYLNVSRRWLRDYGLGERDLHGMRHYDVFPEIPEHWREAHRRALAGETLRADADPFERPDGSTQWIRWEVLPWRDAQGGIGGIVIFSEDLSELKRGEEARAQLEASLRESQKMEALGTLAGGIAHDFNNMLAIITGNAELVRQDVGAGHRALESLEEIGKASRRAKDLVQQILAFGRRQVFELKPTSLSMVVLESARLLRAGLPANVSLEVDCKTDTPAVLADATQVSQILINLCSNAAQAVRGQERPGTIAIRLEGYTRAESSGALRPERYACLTVRDNGAGMDEASRLHIFEPFFTTRPVGEGTGLGLAVVYSIVEAHQGSIEVESRPGEGSVFRVYFPAIEAPAQAGALAEVAPEAAPLEGKGAHILYVDDEEVLVYLIKRLLERQGYRVSGFTDPEEALAAVRANPGGFDLVVTDYNMPHLSGLDVAQALKEMRPDLPVLLASGYITEELRAKAPAAGIRKLIYKPNTVDELCAAVAHFVKAQKSGAAS